MSAIEKKNLSRPGDRRSFEKGTAELASLGGFTFGRAILPPGRDAWVVGDEPVVVIDISGMENYEKPK